MQSICKEQGFTLQLLQGGIFTSIISNFSAKKICLFPLLIYIIIYISMDSWIFISYFQLKSNAIFSYSNCSSFGHWELFQWAPCLFYMPSLLQDFVLFCLVSLSSVTRGSRLISCISCSSSRIYPFSKMLCSFSWRIVLKTKMSKLYSSLLKCYSF